LNRNIITKQDVALAKAGPPERTNEDQVHDEPLAPPKPPEADSWYQRVLKYMPGEAVGLYLFLDNLCKLEFPLPDKSKYETAEALAAAFTAVHEDQRPWLGAALAVALVFNWLYLWRIWKVQRVWQLVISCAALIIYVFAIGGVFATYSCYRPALGIGALAVGAAFLAFVEPPGPLAPSKQNQGDGGV
jgi:hypothetical protein